MKIIKEFKRNSTGVKWYIDGVCSCYGCEKPMSVDLKSYWCTKCADKLRKKIVSRLDKFITKRAICEELGIHILWLNKLSCLKPLSTIKCNAKVPKGVRLDKNQKTWYEEALIKKKGI